MKKKLFLVVVSLSAILLFTSVVFAETWASFSAQLPANQGDTEVSTVKRATNNHIYQVSVSSISGGFSSVCAWAENTAGLNLSSPSFQISTRNNYSGYLINYYSDRYPKIGSNVVLNLDNPVKTTAKPTVKGTWTPW